MSAPADLPPGYLRTGDLKSQVHLILAHGAGAPPNHSMLSDLAERTSEAGLCVHRFAFAYMHDRQLSGKKHPPPPMATLEREYEAAVDSISTLLPANGCLLIGGKSMGGRVASLIANTLYHSGTIAGLVLVSYPFHPPGRPAQLRTAHLQAIPVPTIVVQGTRDPFGRPDEVAGYQLSSTIQMRWIDCGDHDLKPPARGAMTHADALKRTAEHIRDFAALSISPGKGDLTPADGGPARRARARRT